MGVGQLSESDAVDALRLPFYSSRHARGSNRRAITLIWGIPGERGMYQSGQWGSVLCLLARLIHRAWRL